MERVPAGPTASTTAPWTMSGGVMSPAGDPRPRLPPIVARFRTGWEARWEDACQSAG